MPQDKLTHSRRDLMVGAAGVALGASVLRAQQQPAPLRVAHLTDMHVQPERRAGDGYAAALQSLDKLDHKPDFILTGGDHIMDTWGQPIERATIQWDVYEKTLAANTRLPVYPVIGNHDVWAWGVEQKDVAPDSVGYGKAMAMDRLKLKERFYSFDRGGWHFICLDNIVRKEFDYIGSLDDEQMEWLKADLAANKSKPGCIITHIPLLCACAYFDGERLEGRAYIIPDSFMHRDVKPLLLLLRDNNVKLCLSGHIYLVDAVQYLGMTFLCNGAVSGDWWKGPRDGFAEGYGIIDLWPDGDFKHQYLPYGWKADPA